jgi:hypothetical protein
VGGESGTTKNRRFDRTQGAACKSVRILKLLRRKKNQLPNDDFPFGDFSLTFVDFGQTTKNRRLTVPLTFFDFFHQTKIRRLATDFFFGTFFSKF